MIGRTNAKASAVSSAVVEKDVNFYDYDGTLLYSYTTAEANALSALPALPDRTAEGLTAQEWNYTLAEVQSIKKADIGVTYTTTDGKTKAFLTFTLATGLNPTIYFTKSDTSTLSIELRKVSDNSLTWSTTTSASGNRNATVSGMVDYGDYYLTMEITSGSGTYGFSNGSFSTMFIGGSNAKVADALTKLFVGSGATLGFYSLYESKNLKYITIPNTILEIDGYALTSLTGIVSIVIPNSCDFINITNQNFRNLDSLKTISLPSSITQIPAYFLSTARIIKKIILSKNITYIENNAFYQSRTVEIYDFSNFTSIPTLGGTTAFSLLNSLCKIKVPFALEATWKTATNWSTYANYIIGV